MEEEVFESTDNSIAYDGDGNETYQRELPKLRAVADTLLWIFWQKKKDSNSVLESLNKYDW